MKKTLLIGILILFTVSLNAQGQYQKALRSSKQGTSLAFSDYTIGLKFGCPWSVMLDSKLSKVNYTGNIGYTIGLVAERYFQRISVGIEGMLSQKGTKIYYDMPYQSSLTETDIFHREYYLGYNVVSVRIPVTYYFKGAIMDDKAVPYVFIAPQVDIPMTFNATLRNGTFLYEKPASQTTYTTYDDVVNKVTKPIDTKSLFNIGALAGIGLMGRIPTENSAIIIKFDIAANYGLRNLAEEGFIWKKDPDTGKLVLKDNIRTIRTHDVEANLTIILPIKKRLRDACFYFEK